MIHLFFNWVIRKYWGEDLASEVLKFVLSYKGEKSPFRLEVAEIEKGKYHLSIYCFHPSKRKSIFKFKYSIKDGK